MKERQILFSAPMVSALLDGIKTQTRRIVKPHPRDDAFCLVDYGDGYWPYRSEDGESPNVDNMEYQLDCPYGQPGDRLWMREGFAAFGRWETRFNAKKGRDEWHFVDMTAECGFAYLFDLPPISGSRGSQIPTWHNRPSIFMPRAASRIHLLVMDVRVERLQDISEEDAIAEGIEGSLRSFQSYEPKISSFAYAADGYRSLWESINGAGSWKDNPWVWVVGFRRIAP